MKLQESLEKLFVLLSQDEILLRLLHYTPKNAIDDPLSLSKPNILDMDIGSWDAIVKNVLIPSDKTYDLVLKTEICRICFYTGTRKPIDNYSSSNRGLIDNPYVSEQKYNFDVYVHVNIDIKSFRLTAIIDRLNELMLLKKVTDIGDFTLDFISPISNTPVGFLGMKVVFKTISLQEGSDRKW